MAGVPACGLGESARWAHGAWWWIDAEVGAVWTAGPDLVGSDQTAPADVDGVARQVLHTGGRVSLVQPATDGRVVVASGVTLLVLDPGTGATVRWSRVPAPPGWLLNDGTADAAGRLWIGSVHPERQAGKGQLHVVDRDGTVRTIGEGFTLSNGMAWTAADRLLHADSLERCLWEHDVDPDAGVVVGSRRGLDVAALAETMTSAETVTKTDGEAAVGDGAFADRLALPDGLAIDAAGGLWIAVYGAGQAWRVVDGRVDTVVEVPTPQVTSVALGGPDGRDLLVTTAQEGMDAAARAADPWAGRLYRARVEVPAASCPLLQPTVTSS